MQPTPLKKTDSARSLIQTEQRLLIHTYLLAFSKAQIMMINHFMIVTNTVDPIIK